MGVHGALVSFLRLSRFAGFGCTAWYTYIYQPLPCVCPPHTPLFGCEQDADSQRVMLRLSKEYPGDLGILMPLMLNLLQLKPGNAFFMTVDEPHAYLRGDILEVTYCILTHACVGLLAYFVLCTRTCLVLSFWEYVGSTLLGC